MTINVLVIDDEIDVRNLISDVLKNDGYYAITAANSSDALSLMNDNIISVIILDIWLQGSDLDGLSILEIIKTRFPIVPVIIICDNFNIETALNAIKIGAYDYLEKPFYDKLTMIVKRAYETIRLRKENLELKTKVLDKALLIGKSSITLKLISDIEKASTNIARVIIHGGIGSGKELAARLIHKQSKRFNQPFVIFSPTNMSLTRMQYELFQDNFSEYYAQSNIMVSQNKRYSVLELANHGTLYIDEIADMHLAIQEKLLKFLQDQVFYDSYNNSRIKLDIRVIASTSKNLVSEIKNNRFKEDLYHRLNLTSINIPPLYERKEDIPLLINHFVKQLIKLSNLKERVFSDEAVAVLQSYNWPGNIRQLRNVIEWVLIMHPPCASDISAIKPSMLPCDLIQESSAYKVNNNHFIDVDTITLPLKKAREIFETQYLLKQMDRFSNNISKTAAFVGMERSALHRKLRSLNIKDR